jgi:hypothetical protein
MGAGSWGRLFCLVLASGLVAASVLPAAELVVNGDFEADTAGFVVWPGYVGGNNPAEIPSWTGTGGRGINPVVPGGAGDAPFRDNGGNTTSIAFLQGNSSIQQVLSGFTVGQDYVLSLDFNSRNCCGDFPTAVIMLNDQVAGSSAELFPAPGSVPPVGGANPWYHADIEFTAPVDTITLTISAAPSAGGDATLIVDNVSVEPVPEPSTVCLALAGLALVCVWRRR